MCLDGWVNAVGLHIVRIIRCDTFEESGQKKGSACGFQQATIDKIASKDFAKQFPGAYKLYKAMQIDNDTQNKLMLEIDQKGRKLETVIAEWIDANEATWGPWVKAAK